MPWEHRTNLSQVRFHQHGNLTTQVVHTKGTAGFPTTVPIWSLTCVGCTETVTIDTDLTTPDEEIQKALSRGGAFTVARWRVPLARTPDTTVRTACRPGAPGW